MLELQLQQIAALNISDVFSVVIAVASAATAAASDYLMHLHIWPKQTEGKVDMLPLLPSDLVSVATMLDARVIDYSESPLGFN